MAGGFGWSFMPGGEPAGRGMGGVETPPDPIQEAIKVMSLRLPKTYGARSIAPAPLMESMGGMGQPSARGNVTAQALAMLAGVPMRSVPAPTMPQPTDVPSADQDRNRGVSRALPRPSVTAGIVSGSDSRGEPATGVRLPTEPPYTPKPVFAAQPAPDPHPRDPYEELRFILGMGRDNYNLR